MSVLDRSALLDSPLADLHAIASELSIDGYRRLRRDDLVAAILDKQSGETPATTAAPAAEDQVSADAPSSDASADAPSGDASTETTAAGDASAGTASSDAGSPTSGQDEGREGGEAESGGSRRRRGRRGGRGRAATEAPSEPEAAQAPPSETAGDDEMVEGVVELLTNGSGFVRVHGNEPSDDDVYISSAQVKRCELVSGDLITGPKRAPRRSERFPSLIRIETINGRPASELADSVHFDDLPAALPSDRLTIDSEDPTLKAIEWLTPFGRGSRVTITGAARAGKSEALKRLAAALAQDDELTVTVALAGVRPEEISEWTRDPARSGAGVGPAAAVSFAASEELQNGTIEPVVDQARRLAARGAHAVVLIDTLDGLSPQIARKVMASARNIVDGGSVTVIATASEPLGGETTVISLDVAEASLGRFPALDLLASGTLAPELLVGEGGAEAIARTRAEVLEADDEQ